jgi:1,2-phenylacetyl-CoA epoxidase PaaB subunit
MNATNSLVTIITAMTLAGSASSYAQKDERPPLYVSVECMKSTSSDYTQVELDIWQSMHQEMVNRGERNSWALYEVLYGDRSKCDFYTVTTLIGEVQLNQRPAYEEIFKAVHPDDEFEDAMARTWASRKRVATELWVVVDSTEIKDHRFAVVNRMNASDADVYERMESQVFKHGHQALIESGHRSGWGLYALVSPLGTSIPYNYSTVDFSRDLNPVPMAEAMMAANPDRDLDAMQDLLTLREQVSSETWALIAATHSPSN